MPSVVCCRRFLVPGDSGHAALGTAGYTPGNGTDMEGPPSGLAARLTGTITITLTTNPPAHG
jgi:hypothetical protein